MSISHLFLVGALFAVFLIHADALPFCKCPDAQCLTFSCCVECADCSRTKVLALTIDLTNQCNPIGARCNAGDAITCVKRFPDEEQSAAHTQDEEESAAEETHDNATALLATKLEEEPQPTEASQQQQPNSVSVEEQSVAEKQK